MGVVVPHKAIDIVANAVNPKKAILDIVGDLSGVHVPRNLVLLGTYFRPQKTAGGIIRPDSNVEEDMWQGKCGLVLKLGTEAFKDSDDYTFAPEDKYQVGDWVTYFVNEARSIQIKGYPCRTVRDSGLELKVIDPNIIF